MKKNNKKKGFTIVELVIVIGVIGILSAILIPTFVGLTNNARTAAMKEECANTYTAYTTEAVDGKIEKETKEYSIKYAAQDKVEFSKGGKFYRYESGEWKEFTASIGSTNLVVANTASTSATAEKLAEYSTFNTYVVYYFE